MGPTLYSEFGMPKGHLKWGNGTRDAERRLKASLWEQKQGPGSCQDDLEKRIKDEGRGPSTLRSPQRGMKRYSQRSS